MAGRFGVDLSEYQKGIDFDQLVREEVEFVILRGGDGSYADQQFATFYAQAQERGLPTGAYWFSRATTQEQARAEAQRFFDVCLRGRRFELPVYMDVESESQRALSRAALTAVCRTWCSHLRSLGFLPGIYTSSSWASSALDLSELDAFELWIAQWSRNPPSFPHGMWQFGGETNLLRNREIAGMTVDQNFMRRDYPAIIRERGLNGYPKGDGEMRYITLADLKADRNNAQSYVPTVEKLLARDILRGKGGQNDATVLDLGEDAVRLLVVLDRAGLFNEAE